MHIIAIIASTIALGGAPTDPGTLQIGPMPGPGVHCHTVRFRDLVRGRTYALRLCIRTHPLRAV